MGSRHVHARLHERDEGLEVPIRETTPAQPARQEGRSERLLSMQRTYGNAAVTLAVQRRDRPASTDAPGHHDAPKKAAPAADYAPTSSNPKFADWSDADLSERASHELDSDVKNAWSFAADLYEEYWFRHQGRAGALGPYRAYKKLGDAPREQFWLGVMQGTIKPGAKAAEDQTGKEF